MNLFQILDATCSTQMQTLIGAVKFILTLIRWAIPIVLIILGSIDMFKAMASGEDKKADEAKKTFIRRLVYAVVAFLIPFIITLTFDVVASIIDNDKSASLDDLKNQSKRDGNFFECWDGTNKTSYYDDDEDEEIYDEEECLCILGDGVTASMSRESCKELNKKCQN